MTLVTRFIPFLILPAYLCLLGVDVYLVDHLSKTQMTEILKTWVPLGLKVNFFLLLAALLMCAKDIIGLVRKFLNRKGVLLAILLCLAFVMSSFLTVRTHRIYYDEDIYANVGQTMALDGRTGFCNYGVFEYGEYFPRWLSYNKEPSGWPFLISVVFQLLGTNELYAFLLNNGLFVMGVLTAFLIPWYLTESFFVGFSAALIYALIPHNLIWFNTAAAEPSAAVMAGLCVLSLVIYLKTRKARHLFPVVLLFPMACQMRPESFMILPLLLVAVVVIAPRTLLDRKFWAAGLLSTLFLLPHFLHFFAVSGHSWGAEGSKFSLEFLSHNLDTNGLYYLKNRHFPVIITGFAFLGLFAYGRCLRWRLLMLGWFLLFWGIFLFFYAGSYHYGADVRFALVSFMPLSIMAGMGAGRIREILLKAWRHLHKPHHLAAESLITGLLLFSFLKFVPMVRTEGQEAWGSRFDHKYAYEFIQQIPDRSIVLTQNPTMFLLWNQNAIQTYAGINNRGLIRDLMKKYQGHVYFHENYWCNTKNERNVRLCRKIRETYDLEPVVTAGEQHYEYGLYRMRFKNTDDKTSD